ncbi:MAG: hypothetical protein V1725_03285 [archaeon]
MRKIFSVLFLLALLPFCLAFQAELDKNVYVTNATLVVSGITEGNATINASISTGAGTTLAGNGTASDGTFSLSFTLTDYAAGDYTLIITENASRSITLPFSVVAEELTYLIYIIPESTTYLVNTSSIDDPNTPGFADLLATSVSLSQNISYGNVTLDGLMHLALVDSNAASIYDTLYVDDDANFSLYNNDEDTTGVTEKTFSAGDIFRRNASSQEFLIAAANTDGMHALIAQAMNASSFSSGQTAHYLIITEDAAGNMVGSKTLNISITSPNGSITQVNTHTNDDGYYLGNISAGTIGSYDIRVNDQAVEFVNVESFSLIAKTTDVSSNPTSSFMPGATARISALAKATGTIITLDSISLAITYPNGTIVRPSMNHTAAGEYMYDFTIPSTLQGSYAIRIVGAYEGNNQTVTSGFIAESTSFELFSINTAYLDEVEQGGEGVFVTVFAPGKNITVMATQSDLSLGGFMNGATVAIENENRTCSDAVSVVELKDDKGRTFSISNEVMIRSLENLTNEGFLSDVNPPQEMMQQCMIVITNTSLPAGFYTLKAKLQTSTTKYGSTSFSIQRLLATGSTVDQNGQGFGFFSPLGVVNVKVALMDMTTDEEVNTSQILETRIVEVQQQYPSFADATTDISNESFNSSSGIISFTAPSSEGFYSMQFRFKANMSGTIYEGVGSAFFELKKYIIFAEPQSDMEGTAFIKPGENITLNVNVVDIDKGGLFDIGYSGGSSQMSCTGCSGFIATISTIRNEQLFEEIDPSNYTLVNGSIINSTSGATLLINPAEDFDSGFYSVDVILTNPDDPAEQYFGWGYFEIRSFFVKLEKANYDETNDFYYVDSDNDQRQEDAQFERGQPLQLIVQALIPSPQGTEDLNITSTEIVNILNDEYERPIAMDCAEAAIVSIDNYNKTTCDYEDNCVDEMTNALLANISCSNVIDNEGWYVINVRAYTDEGSDIGTSYATVSSYQIETTYRGSDFWDPLFASDEVLEINITATDFSGNNVTLDNATPEFISDKNKGKPKRINASVWNESDTTCTGNLCTVHINLSTFEAGRYAIDIIVLNNESIEQSAYVEFQIKNVVFAIPQILQSWNWLSDTASTGDLNIWGSEDRCNNRQRSLSNDPYYNNMANSYLEIVNSDVPYTLTYLNDTLDEEDNFSIRINIQNPSGERNLTNMSGFNKSEYAEVYGALYCVQNGDTISSLNTDLYPCDIGTGIYVGVATNTTHIWIKQNGTYDNSTGMYDMGGATAITDGIIPLNSSSWNITLAYNDTGTEKQMLFYDSLALRYLRDGPNYDTLAVSEKPGTITVDRFCFNGFGDITNTDGDCSPGNILYVVMNGTHARLTTTSSATGYELNGSWIETGTVGVEQMAIAKVGYDAQGNFTQQNVLIVPRDALDVFTPQGSEGNLSNFTLPDYFPAMYGRIFCVGNENASQGPAGPYQWDNQGDCNENQTRVFVFSNGTAIWLGVGDDNDLTDSTPILIGGTSEELINNYNWTVVNITGQEFSVKLGENRICGESWTCNQHSCNRSMYTLKAPQSDSTFYFDRVNLINRNWNEEEFPAFPTERYVYIYHNTTDLWMMNVSEDDFSSGQTAARGATILDPTGGNWTIQTLAQSSITLLGNNVGGTMGTYIDMASSQSGVVRIGRIREEELGYFKQGGRSGMDLNNNGLANDTFYYALLDNETAGVYDTFYFSGNSNFSQPISINANRSTRTIGNGQLTLLSIDPRADRINFYSRETGDWSDLGDVAATANIRVPVIIRSPAGVAIAANVSTKSAMYNDNVNSAMISFTEVTMPINGRGELVINESAANTTFSAGQHFFEISATVDGETYYLEQWLWPRVNLRKFLTTERSGYAKRISNFSLIPTTQFRRDTTPAVEVRAENASWNGYQDNEGVILGVAENTYTMNDSCTFQAPEDVSGDDFEVRMSSNWRFSNPRYYFYFSHNDTDAGRVWIQNNSCNFSGTSNYTAGQPINLTLGNAPFFLTVLFVNSSSNYAAIGLNITNTTAYPPPRYDGYDNMPIWAMMSLNYSGTFYNAILLNSSDEEMPVCTAWNSQECVTGARFTTTGTYGDIIHAGETITGQVYLAGIGPQTWAGVTFGNSSGIKPLVGDINIQDNTPLSIREFNESLEGYDIDLNASQNNTYYILAFDDRQNGQQSLTRILTDDDLEITSDWRSQDEPPTYYDIYGNETGMSEQWGSTPAGIWEGNLRFYEETDDTDWQTSPGWNIQTFNTTDMLLSKDVWCGIANTTPIAITIRAYAFNQSPIIGAGLNATRVLQFGFFGTRPYTDYSVSAEDTDQEGYGIITITPTIAWERGEYLFRIRINTTTGNETVDKYMQIGQSCGGN